LDIESIKQIQVNSYKIKNIMKKSIALAALLLALGTSVFAATPAKSDEGKSNQIAFVPLSTDRGFGVVIDKQEAGKSFVMIYDKQGTLLYKDYLTKGTNVEKNYNISGLDNGDYTVEVVSNKESVTKHLKVYDEDDKKTYMFIQ